MRVLDLFCGAGGAAMGLHQAWPEAEIVGVDNKPQPRYPFTFVQADALTFDAWGFDFIWASPPCQHFSAMNNRFGLDKQKHPNLIAPVRERLRTSGAPYVIENVVGAPLENPITLCGSMFGLDLGTRGYLRRHRLFESSFPMLQPSCSHKGRGRALCVAGHGATDGIKGGMKLSGDDAREIMRVPWMTRDGASQAIPPAFSEFIGRQFTAIQWAEQATR